MNLMGDETIFRWKIIFIFRGQVFESTVGIPHKKYDISRNFT